MKTKFLISLFFIFINFEASSNETINIDLKFYSLNDVVMKRKNLEMKSWIAEDDIKKIVECVNNIYERNFKKYKVYPIIQFNYISLTKLNVLSTPGNKDIKKKINFIVKSTRNDGEVKKKKLKKYIQSFFGKKIIKSNDRMKNINIYFVPFYGNTRQGFAYYSKSSPYKKDVFLSEWTNKDNLGQQPHKRNLLPKKYVTGLGYFNSLCKTLGHEIGHVLNLTHHKKPKQINILANPNKYLMVGSWGTEMKKKEVERSLKTAKKILK
jgi:hypothetical protein